MSTFRRVLLATVVVIVAGSGSSSAQRAATGTVLGDILQSELRRNIELLKREQIPPYFASYTVHDLRTTRIQTSFGALHTRSATRKKNSSRTLDRLPAPHRMFTTF